MHAVNWVRRVGVVIAALLAVVGSTGVAAQGDPGDVPPRPVCVIVGYDNHGRPIIECFSYGGGVGDPWWLDDECWYCARYVSIPADLPTEPRAEAAARIAVGLALLATGAEKKAMDALRGAAHVLAPAQVWLAETGDIAGKQLVPNGDQALRAGGQLLVDGLAAAAAGTDDLALRDFRAALAELAR